MNPDSTSHNLDTMSADETAALIRSIYHLMTRERSKVMRRVYRHLISYVRLRDEAEYERMNGNVDMAIRLESVMERIYNKLPKFWRW